MIKPAVKICVKSLCISFFMLLSLLVILFVRLNMKPLELEGLIPFIEKKLVYQGYNLKLDNIRVYYDGSLNLEGEHARLIYNKEDVQEEIKVENIRLVLSNRNLVLGRVLPKHVYINGLNINLSLDEEKILIGGIEFGKGKGNQDSLIHILNNPVKQPFLRFLKSVNVDDISITFEDKKHEEIWFFSGGQAYATHAIHEGDSLDISGIVSKNGHEEKVPVNFTFHHAAQAKKSDLEILFENADTTLLESYIPLKGVFQAKGSVGVQMKMNQDNTFSSPNFFMNVGKGYISLEHLYSKPFHFQKAKVAGHYDSSIGEFILSNTEVLDASGTQIFIKGGVRGKGKDLVVDLDIRSPKSVRENVMLYLPDNRISGVVNWLENHMSGGKMKNLYFGYHGKPSELPFCGKDCGLSASFEYEDLEIKFLPHTPPAKKLRGHFEMKEDYIKITAKDGVVGNQSGSNMTATINGHFDKGPVDRISIEGRLIGGLQEVIEIVADEIGYEEMNYKIDGTHISDVWVQIPLTNFSLERVYLKVDSSVQEVSTRDFLGGRLLTVDTGRLNVTEKNLDLFAQAEVEGDSFSLQWKESVPTFGKETFIQAKGVVSSDKILPYIGKNSFTKEVPVTLELQKVENGNFDFSVDADFSESRVEIPDFNWVKPGKVSLNLQARGQTSVDFNPFSLDFVSLSGSGTEVLGSVYYDKNNLDEFSLNASRFVLGRNNFTINHNDGFMLISGESIDLGNMDFKEGGKTVSNNLKVRLNFENVYMSNGMMKSLRGEAVKKNGKFDNIFMESRLLNGNIVSFVGNREGRKSGAPLVVDVMAQDAGETLRVTGAYKSLRGGQLTGQLNINDEEGVSKSSGEIEIKQARIVNAPVLAQIFSLLSIEEVLSGEQGILFNKIKIPLSSEGSVYHVHKAELEGPSIGMTFRGDVDLESKKLNLKGQLIPVATLNKLVGKIPIVGKILTGSQEGLLVADFSVAGNMKNPDISANPFSVVTPGILKDIFSFLSVGGKSVSESTD